MFAPEKARDEADPGEVLDGLHLVIRREQRAAGRERAVVRQEQTIMRADVPFHRYRELARRRRSVLRDRNAAEGGHHFGEHGPVERDAGHGEPGGDRRMRVHDSLEVGPAAIHGQVHQQFGRRVAIALHFPSRHVGDHHHVGRHETLRDALRCRQKKVAGEAHADVAVVRRDVSAIVQTASDLDDVGSERFFGGHLDKYCSRQRSEQK